MAAGNAPRRLNDEPALLAFLARRDQSADYVRRTAIWIKVGYPGSVHILPKLREIYKTKLRENPDV